MNYKKIWEEHNGTIPIDKDGRPYEIHHKDGNNKNNKLENLQCLTIKEHYDIHYEQGDYGACVLIAKRMLLPVDFISNIQKGKKRPGIGGVKKGTIPWNKGKNGYNLNITEKGKNAQNIRIEKHSKISRKKAEEIRNKFENKILINNDNINKTQQNGKKLSYERAFCKQIAQEENITPEYVYRILRKKSRV